MLLTMLKHSNIINYIPRYKPVKSHIAKDFSGTQQLPGQLSGITAKCSIMTLTDKQEIDVDVPDAVMTLTD